MLVMWFNILDLLKDNNYYQEIVYGVALYNENES